MQLVPWQSLTVRLPSTLIEAISQIAARRGLTMSEWVRSVVQTQLDLDPAQRHHATVLYEVAKTRALVLRLLDMQLSKAEVEKLVTTAEEDAADYVRERVEQERRRNGK